MSDAEHPQVARIPAGEFTMGAEDGEEDERPSHRVYLDEFCIGVYPVTNDQYAAFVREAKYRLPAVRQLPRIVTTDQEQTFRELASPYVWRSGDPPGDRGHHPVTLVTIEDALAYCRWLAIKTRQPVRLPTEAEWERAARGGVDGTHYPWGDELDPAKANYLSEAGNKQKRGTQEVGSYPPNNYNIFDAVGNVWEWVADWYQHDVYTHQLRHNPKGPGTGMLRLLRGGAWVVHDPNMLRVAYRHKVPPDTYAYSIGFRIAYSTKPPS
jgi:formylglycine-generating enzyme required for sulfatase activity